MADRARLRMAHRAVARVRAWSRARLDAQVSDQPPMRTTHTGTESVRGPGLLTSRHTTGLFGQADTRGRAADVAVEQSGPRPEPLEPDLNSRRGIRCRVHLRESGWSSSWQPSNEHSARSSAVTRYRAGGSRGSPRRRWHKPPEAMGSGLDGGPQQPRRLRGHDRDRRDQHQQQWQQQHRQQSTTVRKLNSNVIHVHKRVSRFACAPAAVLGSSHRPTR